MKKKSPLFDPEVLNQMLTELRLPTFRNQYESLAQMAATEGLSFEQYLFHLAKEERLERQRHRVERNLKSSRLPLGKTFDNFDMKRLPQSIQQQSHQLRMGKFLQRKENILVFGTPGAGKTHLMCALATELIEIGYRARFYSCSLLVQELLLAKKNLELTRMLRSLNKYDLLIIDDIGYVQQTREEMEVLFTLLAERYEKGSVMITSNLPFGKWEQIFKDPMTTAAVIDRLVHHSVILELNIKSYRLQSKIQSKEPKSEEKEESKIANPSPGS